MDSHQQIVLTKEQLDEIIEHAVDEAFVRMGIDSKNPLNMQRDFQYIRELRETSDVVKSRGLIVMVGIAVSGVCGVLWLGVKQLFH